MHRRLISLQILVLRWLGMRMEAWMKGGDSCIKYQTHILVVEYQFPLKLMPRFTSCPQQAVALTSHLGIFIFNSTSAPLPKQTHFGFLPFINLEDSVNACSPLNNERGWGRSLTGRGADHDTKISFRRWKTILSMACAYVQVHSSQAVHTTSRYGNICPKIQQTTDLSNKADVPFRRHSIENLLFKDMAWKTPQDGLSQQCSHLKKEWTVCIISFETYWLVQRNHEISASVISKGSTIESRNLDNKGSFFQAWLQRVRLYQQCFRLKWYGQCLIIMSHPERFIQQHRVRLHHILPLERQGRTCVRVRICQWDEGNKDKREEPRHHSSIATMQLSRRMMKFHSTVNSNPWRKRQPTTCTTCCKNKKE
jgi:hypothetical protein